MICASAILRIITSLVISTSALKSQTSLDQSKRAFYSVPCIKLIINNNNNNNNRLSYCTNSKLGLVQMCIKERGKINQNHNNNIIETNITKLPKASKKALWIFYLFALC